MNTINRITKLEKAAINSQALKVRTKVQSIK